MDTAKTQITKFDLKALALKLQKEAARHAKKKVSQALFKDKDRHVYLVAMHAGAVVAEHATPCPLNVHVLAGRLCFGTKEGRLSAKGGELVVLEAGSHYNLQSEGESLFVLEFFPAGTKHTFSGDQDDYFDNWV